MGEGTWQKSVPIDILEFDRELQPLGVPGDRHAKPQTDGKAGVACRETGYPQGVPTTTEDEQLPAYGLNRIGKQSHVNTGAERIW